MSREWDRADERFMRAALEQANAAAMLGEVPVGAVVVADSHIVASAHNQSVTRHDPCGHAEILGLRSAGAAAGNYRLPDATLFVTLEPCPMCIGAMLHARIARLVFGAYDPKSGAAGSVIDLSNERRLNHRIEVNGGLLQQECLEMLQRFFADKRDG